MLDVGQGHRIYVEQCGNPKGLPVLVVHGGPGGGCSPTMRRFFDPQAYRIVLFDQRGCGRSRPFASVEDNTTDHLIADIEVIRHLLEIEDFILFGGSWGATLSLCYAIAHPQHVRGLILRGVFLGSREELDWFYGGGAGAFFPELWEQFRDAIPAEEQQDLVAAYYRRLFSGKATEEIRFGRLWANWENALASISYDGYMGEAAAEYARAFARLENHYFINNCFLSENNFILNNINRISHLPGYIVQGRFDMICPPKSAYALARAWENCRLEMVGLAGHALSEPGILSALVRATDRLRA